MHFGRSQICESLHNPPATEIEECECALNSFSDRHAASRHAPNQNRRVVGFPPRRIHHCVLVFRWASRLRPESRNASRRRTASPSILWYAIHQPPSGFRLRFSHGRTLGKYTCGVGAIECVVLDKDTEIGGPDARFPDTRHSVLFGTGGGEPARRALDYEAVITAYWKPVYRYIRVKWNKSNEDAKDLTQAFFALAVENNLFRPFDHDRGTFRTYLRICLDRFLANRHRFESRQKRSAIRIPFDDSLANEVLSADRSPEELFERECARSLFSAAIEQLRTALPVVPFAVFERYDLADPSQRLSYRQIACELNIPVTTVTNYLALARRELRRILLNRLRGITRDEGELRREARALFYP